MTQPDGEQWGPVEKCVYPSAHHHPAGNVKLMLDCAWGTEIWDCPWGCFRRDGAERERPSGHQIDLILTSVLASQFIPWSVRLPVHLSIQPTISQSEYQGMRQALCSRPGKSAVRNRTLDPTLTECLNICTKNGTSFQTLIIL